MSEACPEVSAQNPELFFMSLRSENGLEGFVEVFLCAVDEKKKCWSKRGRGEEKGLLTWRAKLKRPALKAVDRRAEAMVMEGGCEDGCVRKQQIKAAQVLSENPTSSQKLSTYKVFIYSRMLLAPKRSRCHVRSPSSRSGSVKTKKEKVLPIPLS